ncbi:MAG: lysophospholipase [Spirochaetaceae bacterium]|nr:lysophospholipase [Spirochaetaceae bacterium]
MKGNIVFCLAVFLILSCNSERGSIAGVENFSYETLELSASRDGLNIYGQALIPKSGGGKFKTIIISHGFGGTYQSLISFARDFASNGIATYVFDFCGGSPRSSSDGKTFDMSVFTEQEDLNAVIDMIKRQDFVDDKNIFLFGHSQGGFVSAITAADRPADIKGLILYAPAFVISSDSNRAYKTIDDIPERSNMWGVELGKVYWESVYNYNVYDHIGAYTGNVLILHGDQDNIVPVSFAQEAAKRYNSAGLSIYPGAGHMFSGADFEKAANEIIDFVTN